MKNLELESALNELDDITTELESLSSLILYLSSAMLEVRSEPPADLLESPGIELHRITKGIRDNLNIACNAIKKGSNNNENRRV